MEINKVTFDEIIGWIRKHNKMKIPFYQREYDWDESNVRKFLDDILENKLSEYFIGTFLFKGQNNQTIIIDGQQRITTISLIMRCLWNIINGKSKRIKQTSKINFSESYIDQINKFNEFFCIDVESLKNGDSFLKIMSKNISVLNDKDLSTKYYKNYSIIENFLNTHCCEITEFYDNFTKIVASCVSVGNQFNEQKLFSQINSTGKRLSDFDLVKNRLFMELDERFNIDNVENKSKLIDEYLMKFNKAFTVDENTKKKNSDDIKSDIIRYYISYVTGFLCNKNLIAKTFENDILKKHENIIDLFNQLCKFATVYNYCFSSYKNEKKEYAFNKVLDFFNDTFGTYSMLIVDVFFKHITINDDFDIEPIDEINAKKIFNILKILEIYKIRKIFSNSKEKTITRFIPKLVKDINKLMEMNPHKSYDSTLFYLIHGRIKRFYSETDQIPTYAFVDDWEFKSSFVNEKIYKNSKTFVKLLFVRIHRENSKNEIDFSNFSVEHILPQTRDRWDENGYNEDNILVEEKIHTIGNLTITSYNREYSNKIFEDKVREMKKNENFSLNNYFYSLKEWNLNEIHNRALYLYEIITKNIWNVGKYYLQDNDFIEDEESVNSFKFNWDDNQKLIEAKSYYEKLKNFTYENVIDSLRHYLINGYTYEFIEREIFKINFNGFLFSSIYFSFDYRKEQKESFDDITFAREISKRKNEIESMVDYVNKNFIK